MGKRVLLGGLLAAVAMFVWGAVFWMTPMGASALTYGIDNDRVQTALGELFPEDGSYFVPAPPTDGDTETWAAQQRRGPIATVHLRRSGVEPMAPAVFAGGFAQMLLTALLLGALLARAAPALPGWAGRFGLVLVAGLAATIWSHAGDPIWFHHPWRYHLVAIGYDLSSWAIAGAVLARFVRPD